MIDRRISASGPLRSRRARRIAVGLIVATTALLGSLLPTSLRGFGLLVVLGLVGLDILLIQATGGLAFRRGDVLDERERGLRDLAYRRGFRLLGLFMVVQVVVIIATGILVTSTGAGARGLGTSVVDNGITGRALVALLELLGMLPTLVIAWVDADRVGDGVVRVSRRRWLAWLTLPAVAIAWAILIALGPEQAAAASGNSTSSFGMPGATCSPFAGGRMVGAEFGATVGMHVGVCWNGRDAFVYGDPTYPLPQSAIDGLGMPPGSDGGANPVNMDPVQLDITTCGLDNLDDFATVSATSCTGFIDAAGTLHYAVHAQVRGPFGIGQRWVTVALVVDRNGRVLQRP